MLTRKEFETAQVRALEYMKKAGVALTDEETKRIEVADFGLSELNSSGLELAVLINNDRYCVKQLALFPRQTCPEHVHPPINGEIGKQETLRCVWGEIFLCVEGESTPNPKAQPPASRKSTYTSWNEIVLKPGQQHTVVPGTLHWFQGGDQGAVAIVFSSTSRDESDVFTDPDIKRATIIED
ncbi:MAG: D-lyxose/D-mannose family sugar isomerase [bacterium]|jgi:D-lyxose ketol-isomerase